MRRNELNARLRAYAKERLTPTPNERALVSSVYDSVQAVLGAPNCLQIGSYPRFTAVTPLHDLDVLYILGTWDPQTHDPSVALTQLENRLRATYVNPTSYRLTITRQTHSITLGFANAAGDDKFAVDVVPAYTSGKNEFGADKYVVPEIAVTSHRERRRIVVETAQGRHTMRWIPSDPRGYITVAAALNQANDDFRKAVKIVKGWRASCKDMDEEFPLKSFHLEQAVTRIFQKEPSSDIFGAVFRLFCDLLDLATYPQIPDRADPRRNIDEYVAGLTHAQRAFVRETRDYFLIQLENISDTAAAVEQLLAAGKRKRASVSEAYLFDSRIPTLTETEFGIIGTVLERAGGFRRRILDAIGIIEVDRKIEFRLGMNAPTADLYKWRVKNDDNSQEPRGEITDHRTKSDPESTKYNGRHFVECFAIRNNICVGRSRQDVVLNWFGGG